MYCNENARLSCKIWRAVPPSWSLENCSQEPVFAGVHWKNPHIVTWHFTLCTLFSVQFTVYIVHYRLHTVYSTFYTLQSTLLTVQNHFYSCHSSSRIALNLSNRYTRLENLAWSHTVFIQFSLFIKRRFTKPLLLSNIKNCNSFNLKYWVSFYPINPIPIPPPSPVILKVRFYMLIAFGFL